MQLFSLTGLLPVVCALSGMAQTESIVTEAEFLSALDASHPAVIERSQGVAAARSRVDAAAAFDNPVLGVEREAPNSTESQTDWTVSWQLPDLKRRLTIAEREQGVAAARARQIAEILELRQSLREVYAEWAVAVSRAERLARDVARLEALAERQQARANQGEASGLEARRLALAATAARGRLALILAQVDESRAAAQTWFPALPPTARPALPPLTEAPDEVTQHPRLLAARADLQAAKLQRQAADRFVASPQIMLGWQRRELESVSQDGALFGVSWEVPLFRRNRPAQAMASSRVAAARARVELIEQELTSRRAAAASTYDQLMAAAARALAALGGNEQMLQAAETSFRYGEASLTDLLEIQRSVTESEMAWLDLHAAALAIHRDLERLTGRELETSNVSEQETDP